MPEYITSKRIVQGYQPPEFISHLVFPELTEPGSPIKVKKFGKEMFKRFHTKRANLANSNFILPGKIDYIEMSLQPRDAVAEIDKEHTNTIELPALKVRLPKQAKSSVMMDIEIEDAQRLTDTANYPTGNKITLSGTDQFNDHDNSQPIQVVDDGMYAVSKKIGQNPNLMVIPEDVFKIIKWHPHLAIKSTVTGQTEAATIQQLQAKFSIRKIVIAKGLKLNETTNVFEYIWSKDIIFMYVNPNPKPDKEEMSFGYRIREKGYPKVDNDIAGVDKKNKIAYRYKDKFDDVILCAEAAYLIKAAIA
jgi:hypothetical protein